MDGQCEESVRPKRDVSGARKSDRNEWKKITRPDVRGVRPRGRPQIGWMDSVKRVLDPRGMSVEQGRVTVCDRNEWRAVVNA